MQREIILTGDGSHSIAIPALGVSYHSTHGAIQESRHVFINAGLVPILAKNQEAVNILEIGMGTGLNVLLTLLETGSEPRTITYTALETEPLSVAEAKQLNYCAELDRMEMSPIFNSIHETAWNTEIMLRSNFSFCKSGVSVTGPEDLPLKTAVDLVYFDAFAPTVQPELWTEEVFMKLIKVMANGALLVTYCSKSVVRKTMQAAGFSVKKIVGPYGKREMIQAMKI